MPALIYRHYWSFFFLSQLDIYWSLKQSKITLITLCYFYHQSHYWIDVYNKQTAANVDMGNIVSCGFDAKQISFWNIFLGRILKLAVWINVFTFKIWNKITTKCGPWNQQAHFPHRESCFEVDYLNKITDNRVVRKNCQPCS